MADSTAAKNGELFDGKMWFYRKGSILTLGLTDSAIRELGEITSIEYPDEGSECEKGEIVITVDGNQGKFEVMTPARGLIHEINSAVEEEPEVVSEDPLEEGWLIKIEMEDATDLKEFIEN